MKKGTITIIIIVAIVAAIGLWFISVNNRLVGMEEGVSKAWAQVENVYQRRADLIPQLVGTVKGGADFEIKAFTEVTNARSRAMAVNIDANNLSEENVAAFQRAQDELSGSMMRAINVVRESYPELSATQGFRDLQTQLEGTENRIAVERRNFNDVVAPYNVALRRFPTSLAASILGFEKKGYFKASEGADKPVEVKFEF